MLVYRCGGGLSPFVKIMRVFGGTQFPLNGIYNRLDKSLTKHWPKEERDERRGAQRGKVYSCQ